MLLAGYLAATLVLVLSIQYAHYRKLRDLEFPGTYIKTYTLSRLLYLAGVVVMFAVLAYGF